MNFNGASFAGSVDSGLSSLANGIDNHPLPSAYDAVYVQGAINPEATLKAFPAANFSTPSVRCS